MARSLLMIPGPIEVSPGVQAAFSVPPPGHTAPPLIAAFGSALESMRRVWMAEPASQPFVVGGGGTLAMDMAVANLVSPGDRVVVVKTGYFSARMVEMLRRQGAEPIELDAAPGEAPTLDAVEAAIVAARAPRTGTAPSSSSGGGPCTALFATHVDTSTGVRIDPAPLALLARRHGLLSIFDGVCATAGERFEMAEWDADLYFTASQKALGLPPGLALMVASPRALAAGVARVSAGGTPPPMYLDWQVWLPIMRAYEERRAAYFSTPPTNLVLALAAGLAEIEAAGGVAARVERHRKVAAALRTAWRALGLTLLPASDALAANTLSAVCLPESSTVDAATVVARIGDQGVTVAGGLLPDLKNRYFRIGHMGWVVDHPDLLRRTVTAVAAGLRAAGVGDPGDGSADSAAANSLDSLSA